MDFYTENDSFNIYGGPAPGRKIKNMEENPNFSIGFYTLLSKGKIQCMQIIASGRANLIFLKEGDVEFEKAQKIVRGKRKLLLKINPEKIELLDYDFTKKNPKMIKTVFLCFLLFIFVCPFFYF